MCLGISVPGGIHQEDDTRRCSRCVPSNAGLPIRVTGQMIMMGKLDAKLSPERTTWGRPRPGPRLHAVPAGVPRDQGPVGGDGYRPVPGGIMACPGGAAGIVVGPLPAAGGAMVHQSPWAFCVRWPNTGDGSARESRESSLAATPYVTVNVVHRREWAEHPRAN